MTRRGPTRMAGALLSLFLGMAALTGGVHLHNAVDRALAQAPAIQIQAAHHASFVPRIDGDQPVFILALGSDARPGEDVARERADSIHLIGIDPARRRASVVGFPRDAWVRVPGYGRDKINRALEIGGPELVVRTVESLVGIRIDFWLLTSFDGFSRMVDGIGGIVVDVPYRMFDRASGANFQPGPQRMFGGHALSFSRNRHDTPNGDFSRSFNQGTVILSILRKLREDFSSDPAAMLRWIVIGWRHVRTDLDVDTLLDLAMTATQVQPEDVDNLVLPGSSGWAGSRSVVFLGSRAQSIFADLRSDGVTG